MQNLIQGSMVTALGINYDYGHLYNVFVALKIEIYYQWSSILSYFSTFLSTELALM